MQADSLALTFPEVDLEGQEVSLDLVAHQVLKRDQELHCLLQRILNLVKQVHIREYCTHYILDTPVGLQVSGKRFCLH